MALESGVINVRHPHFAPMLKEETAKTPPEYDKFFIMGEATTVQRNPSNIQVPAYGDGIKVEEVAGSTGGEITLGLHAIPMKTAEACFGAIFDGNGVLIESTNDIPSYGALAFESQKANGKSLWTILYKVKFNRPNMQANTKTETVTFQQPSISGTYTARADVWIDSKGDERNIIVGTYDEESEKFSKEIADKWFDAVYEPKALVVPGSDDVTQVTLDKTALTLAVDAIEKLTETVEPTNATNKNVAWTSSDETVATVDTSGQVKALQGGVSTVKVTTESGSKTAECAVTVTGTSGAPAGAPVAKK